MISKKQQFFYKKVLIEIINSNIDIKYNGYKLEYIKMKKGSLENKIKVYHLFFKLFSKIPRNKNILEFSNKEFNFFLEEIRAILAENNYTLKNDEKSFEETLSECKKTTDFRYFLKNI